MRTLRRSLLVLLLVATVAMIYFGRGVAQGVVAREHDRVTLLSRTQKIDRIYQSMMGPASLLGRIELSPSSPPHTIWLTGIDSTLVAPDGQTPISCEFFCHSNLTF